MAIVVIGDTCVQVVIGDTCVQSIMTMRTIIRLPKALSFIVAMAMVVMADTRVQSIKAGYYVVINCLRLFVVPW